MSYEPLCEWTRSHLDAWLDGDLSNPDAARIAHHVSLCAKCSESARLALLVCRTLRGLPVASCPDSVDRRVAGAVYRVTPAKSRASRGWRGLSGLPSPRIAAFLTRPILAIVAGTVIVTVGTIAWHAFRSPRFTDTEIARANRKARVAFAYIGWSSRTTGHLIRRNVVARRVVIPLRDALQDSRRDMTPIVKRAVHDAFFVDTQPQQNEPHRKGDHR